MLKIMRYYLFIGLFFLLHTVYSGRIKVGTINNYVECDINGYIEFSEAFMKWNSEKEAPWKTYNRSKLLKSECFKNNLKFLKEMGTTIKNVKIGNILSIFQNNSCALYLHGNVIRDLSLGYIPNDIDADYSCSIQKFNEICKSHQLAPSCYAKNSSYFKVGKNDYNNREIEGKTWEKAFFNIENQMFTPNSLYFDTENEVIIDLSGKGVEHLFKKQIGIPVEKSKWDKWLLKRDGDDDHKFIHLKKVPKYWKLKAKGYTDATPGILDYMKTNVRLFWTSETYKMKKAFDDIVCDLLNGKFKKSGKCILRNCKITEGYKAFISALNYDKFDEIEYFDNSGSRKYCFNDVIEIVNSCKDTRQDNSNSNRGSTIFSNVFIQITFSFFSSLLLIR